MSCQAVVEDPTITYTIYTCLSLDYINDTGQNSHRVNNRAGVATHPGALSPSRARPLRLPMVSLHSFLAIFKHFHIGAQ